MKKVEVGGVPDRVDCARRRRRENRGARGAFAEGLLWAVQVSNTVRHHPGNLGERGRKGP